MQSRSPQFQLTGQVILIAAVGQIVGLLPVQWHHLEKFQSVLAGRMFGERETGLVE